MVLMTIVESPTMSYQLADGYYKAMMMNFRSRLFLTITNNTKHLSIFRNTYKNNISISCIPLLLATFSAPAVFFWGGRLSENPIVL